jgi:hypothetical protein
MQPKTEVADAMDFEYFCHPRVLRALQRVDRARCQLIEAQNNLAETIRNQNKLTQEIFEDFYFSGGCTAEHWKHWKAHWWSKKMPQGRGHHLRVVPLNAA